MERYLIHNSLGTVGIFGDIQMQGNKKLLLPVRDRLARHPAVATVLLVNVVRNLFRLLVQTYCDWLAILDHLQQ